MVWAVKRSKMGFVFLLEVLVGYGIKEQLKKYVQVELLGLMHDRGLV
jgi:hypothetical protein